MRKIASSLEVFQNSIKIKEVKSVVFRDPYFDYPGNKETGTTENWYYYYFHTHHPQRESAFRNTAYVHIPDQSDGKVLIQYYYFYPFNDWKNNHEGDWQRIDVVVTSRDPSTAELFGVNYWFHGEGINYTQKGGRVFNPQTHFAPAEGGSHPVAYVGAGSHGHFPTGSKYPRKAYNIIALTEHMTKSGIILSTEIDEDKDSNLAQPYDLVMLPNPDTTNTDNMGLSPEMSWLGANVRWGELRVSSPGTPIANIHNSSPVGPFHRGSWGKANKGKYKKTNVPYTEFQHFPIVGSVTWKGTIKLIDDIVIYPGATLTIKPGTLIRVYPQDIHEMENTSRIAIVNYGTLKADDSVFRSKDGNPKDWYGIRNYGMLAMNNCEIRDAVDGLIPKNEDEVKLDKVFVKK